MNIWLALALASIILIFILGITLIVAWGLMVAFYLPLTNDGLINSVLGYAILELIGQLWKGLFLIPASLYEAVTTTFSNIRENLLILTVLALGSTAAFMWLEYHPQLIHSYLQARQCTFIPLWNALIMPIANIFRIIYALVIQVNNFIASIAGFLRYGVPVILLKCTESTLSFSQLVTYVSIFLSTLFADFTRWVTDNPLNNDFNIQDGVEAFANIFIAAIPTLNCFCKGLNFLWVYLETLMGLSSLSATINFAWITVVNFFQIPFQVLQTPDHQPNFTNITLHSCATVISAGDFFEEAVFLTSETIYGLITNMTDLPPSVAAALSIRWTYIITHPVCGIFRLFNMTLVAAVNYDQLIAPDGTGVAYFQFGVPIDELKVAAFQIGDFFDILDNQAQSLVNSSLFALIDILAFLFEWVIGNVYYFSFGGPLPASFGLFNQTTPAGGPANFWEFYFVDYWFKAMPFGQPLVNPVDGSNITFPIKLGNYTYASAVDSFFQNVFRASQSLGDLIGLFDVPLGQAVRHLVNILAALALAFANQISYSYAGITFYNGIMPITERNVNVDLFFNETFFFAGAAGDLFRQFGNLTCDIAVDDVNKNILCLTGNIVETTLDVIFLALQQVVHFVQDLLSLRNPQVKICLFETVNVSQSGCLRIPDFTQAITELDDALCDFGYAVTSLVPFSVKLECPFAPEANVTRTCGRVQTCLGFEFCSILRFIPVILQIINSLFIKIVSGTSFTGFEEFLTFSVGLLVNQFSVVLEQFATFLDCSICAAEGVPVGGCQSPIFDVIHPIADALRDLAKIFTATLLQFVKLLILLVVGFFSGNPVTAIIDFIFGFLQNIFIGIGKGLIDFIDILLHKIGLGFLGSFIKILYTGFCSLLEIIINAIISILRWVSFGRYQHPYVQFCCSDGDCPPHVGTGGSGGGGTRKRMDMPITIGNITMVNMDNWMHLVSNNSLSLWEANDPCNASMSLYGGIPFSQLSVTELGELLFCGAKLIWSHRTDNRSAIMPWTCDRMITENMNRSFTSFNILEQSTIMQCSFTRMLTEGFRDKLNISWLPQDVATNPIRSIYFGAGLAHGALLNMQFFNDKSATPTVLLSKEYRQFWANMHVDVAHYEALKTVEDVVLFKENLHLRAYFEANHATEHDATVYIATGVWALTGNLVRGLANMTSAFSDNITDAGTYLSYNYTLDNPNYASLGSLWGVVSSGFGVLYNMSTYWSDPVNYKKRTEAYDAVTTAGLTMYKASVRQLQLMASEYVREKVHNSSHFYNQTCASEQECRDRGVTAFGEEYEASLRGEGATSLFYKVSSWWDTADFTRYPIQNPRYKDHRVNPPALHTYTREDGTTATETKWQQFWRHITLVRKGTPAAQRRAQIANIMYERTKGKLYTQVLKHYYKADYQSTAHHANMKAQYYRESGRAGALSRQQPQARKQCDASGEYCTDIYDFSVLEYDINHFVANKISDIESRRFNTYDMAHNPVLSAMTFATHTSFFDIPCINEISFPCSYPLDCQGNATTTLCEQCLYLQALFDRAITATDQLITYYEAGGQFSTSVTIAFNFFNYTFNENATVVVGDSPSLHVGLFPAVGTDFWDFLIQSARYMGDDTVNKTRLDDFVARANAVLDNMTANGTNTDVTNSSLFQRTTMSDINGQVFSVISQLFLPVLQFLYDVVLFLDSSPTEDEDLIAYLLDTFLFCDWLVGDDLSGVNKRFSLGELLLIYLALFVFSSVLTIALFGYDILSLVFTTMLATTIFLSTFMTLYANWAYFCFPALPVIFANDIMYFFAYNLVPKCSWFWGFMMESTYDNTMCVSCNATEALVLTHCVYNVGFFDLTYNIAFILEVFFPVVVNYLRTSSGFLRLIADLPPVSARLNYFVNVDLSDPFLWARYQGCDWITTLWANLLIFTIYIGGLAVFIAPAIGFVLVVLSWILDLVMQMLIILFLLFNEIISSPYLTPRYYDDGSPYNNNYGQGMDEEDTAATTTDTTNMSTSFFRQGRTQRPSDLAYRKKPNGLGLSRVLNLATHMKDNWFGDRKLR